MDIVMRGVEIALAVFRLMAIRVGVAGAVFLAVGMVVADPMALWDMTVKIVGDAARGLVHEKVGIELDENDPLSDSSFSAALSAKFGIHISTLVDSNALMADLSAHASGLVQAHTGVHLSNLLSGEQVKADVVTHVENLVQERTGLNIAGATTFDDVQKRISEHVRERLAELVADRLRDAAKDFARPEASLDELLAMVYRAQEAKGIKTRDVALGTAASIVVAAYARTSVPLKRRVDAFRRRAQNREAQRRFRATHGIRMKYDKLPKKAEGG